MDSNRSIILLNLLLLGLSTLFMVIRRDEFCWRKFDYAATLPVRGVLILLVVVTHVSGIRLLQPFQLGTPAVIVFFFMSGYGMARSYERKGPDYLNGFVMRQLAKLFTPFVLCSIVWVLYCHVTWGLDVHRSLSRVMSGNFTPLLPFSWFPFELFVFAVFFWIAYHLHSPRMRLLSTFSLCAVLYLILRYASGWGGWWYGSIWAFPLGCIYAFLDVRNDAWARKFRWRYPVSVLIVYLFFRFVVAHIGMLSSLPLIQEVSSMVICISVATFVRSVPMPKLTLMTRLGTMTYEVYLLHGILYLALGGDGIALLLMLALVVPLAMGLKAISRFLNDRCFLLDR